jgi:hypothetical protein
MVSTGIAAVSQCRPVDVATRSCPDGADERSYRSVLKAPLAVTTLASKSPYASALCPVFVSSSHQATVTE